MQKEVILTGIRANNDLHIGNYFGALLPTVDMAKNKSEQYQINLFVPDLHSFTTPIDHSQLQAQIMNNLKLFVAAGLPLDNDSVRIYRQSYIPAHSELTWILDCFTGFGQMRRMTQFKDKSRSSYESSELAKAISNFETSNDPHRELMSITRQLREMGQNELAARLENAHSQNIESEIKNLKKLSDYLEEELHSFGVSVGLFNYPVLMAADILLYGAKYVPVGDDQTQHLEFTRDIAMRLNNQFGELFAVPEPVAKQHEFFGKDQGLRIKDLVDPTKKMSKSSSSGRGIIFLGDSPEEAKKKIMAATTDSLNIQDLNELNPDQQPGLSNLLAVYKLLATPSTQSAPDIAEGYAYVKMAVADLVADFLKDFQKRLAAVDEQAIKAKLEADEAAMTEVANQTLAKVQKAVGLR